MSAWDVAARSGRGPPPVPSMIRRVRRDVTPRVAARAWAASYNRGAPRVSRGAPNVGGVWGAMSGPPMYSVPDLDGHRVPRARRQPRARHGHELRPDARRAVALLHAHAHRRRRRRRGEVAPPVRA